MMNKKLLLIALPIVLSLSGCANTKVAMHNHMVEDTLAHEEVFGNLNDVSFAKKLTPNKALNEGELYTPILSFQHKDNNDGTYSVRFIATIESKEMDIVWTRSVHDLNGSTTNGKAKGTKQVNTVYESLNDNGERVWATSVEEKDDNEHTKPFNYYAVYCLLNIPNSVSSYYIDAFVTVTLGEVSKNSFVGSVNVADKTKHIKYSLEGGDRYVAEINGEIRESDPLYDGNHCFIDNISLKKNDKLFVYSLDTNALTYKRFGYADNIGGASPNFEAGANDEVVAKYDGTYKVFLNSQDKYYFQKKIYFKGPSWWWDDFAVTTAELRKGTNDSTCTSCALSFWKTVNTDQRLYSGFIIDESAYDNVQFYRAVNGSNNDHTGFVSVPTDGNNYYIHSQLTNPGWTLFCGDPEVEDNSGFQINELLEPQEIHTDKQKAYWEYEGDITQVPESIGQSGSSHLSDSLPVNISWDYTVPNGKTIKNYSIICGKEADLSDGYQPNSVTTKSISYYNPYLGRNYYKLIATFTDNSFEESAIHHFDVDSTYPRNLTIENMTNCRDFGGRVTEDGGVIKQGLIYRTCGNNYNMKNNKLITDAGRLVMINQLKVKNEINVSDDASYNVKLSGVTVNNFFMDYGKKDSSGSVPSSHHFSRNAESVKDFFNFVADSNNYPVFFHCRIGTDRTGLCAILLGGLLGISLDDIYRDYLFSNFGEIGSKRVIGSSAGQDNIENYINEINAMSGQTFKNKVYNTLLTIGVSRNTLDTIIANLTEGKTAQGNNSNQVVATADKLTPQGDPTYGQATGTRDHPDNYYVLNSASKSVSYTFNVEEAYQGQIVAYLGNTEHSTSKYINNALTCKVDGNSVSIRNISYADAGMGHCDNSRMNYYPVILGNVTLNSGPHTITIYGVNNYTMNIGTLCIFNASLI